MRRYCFKFVVLITIVVLSAMFMNYSIQKHKLRVNPTDYTALCTSSETCVFVEDVNSTAIVPSVSCKDENDNYVPWFIAYQAPQVKFNSGGLGYYYITQGSKGWIPIEGSIIDANSIMSLTLANLYQNVNPDSLLSHIIYNDEPPNQPKNPALATGKGVLFSNNEEGIWFIHSIPKFPMIGSQIPPEELAKPQIFACLSLNTSQLNDLGQILATRNPNVFSSFIPQGALHIFPKWVKFLHNRIHGKSSLSNNTEATLELETSDGLVFQVFENFKVDITKDDTPEDFHPGIEEEESPDMDFLNEMFDKYCDNSTAYDILLTESGPFKIRLAEKLTSLKEKQSPWSCITELNRTEDAETLKAFLTLCTNADEIWRSFSNVDTGNC